MAVKRKKKSGFGVSRSTTVALGLCFLAVVTMIGMYTVGRTEEQQKQLEQQVSEAEQAVKAREEQLARERRQAEERQAAAAAASRDQADKTGKTKDGPELESEYESETADLPVTEDETVLLQETAGEALAQTEPALSFSGEQGSLLWPVAGTILLDYSMDKTIYFPTLDQYKCNPALVIQGNAGQSVLSAADGKVTGLETLEETGLTMTMDIGDGYELIYGQLQDAAVQEGSYVKAGELLGYLAEPSRYYSKEGCSLYFEVKKDGTSVDPKTLLP